MIAVAISNRQKALPIDRRRIRGVVRAILHDAGFRRAAIGIAVVDDATIAELHRRFLDDPTPTDVLSFVLEQTGTFFEGEVVASGDTAQTNARRYRAAIGDELLRYIIHGTLHLVGHDDRTPAERAAIRRLEAKYLSMRFE